MKAIALVALLLASPAAADVVSASPNGFEVREVVTVDKAPADAFAAFGRIGSWWSSEHSFSGNSSNLSLDLQPGGCLCERLPNGGGAQFMHVTYVDPPRRVVLAGALGPLLFQADSGIMDVKFEPAGDRTRITLEYRAAGFSSGGADKIAPAVDAVLGDQLTRLKAYLATTR